MARVHILISGFVQGVGFRHFIQRNAESLGLTGWVRNTADGKVEAVLEGEKERVDKMITFCRKGPFGAKVENVEVEWGEATGEFKGFEVK